MHDNPILQSALLFMKNHLGCACYRIRTPGRLLRWPQKPRPHARVMLTLMQILEVSRILFVLSSEWLESCHGRLGVCVSKLPLLGKCKLAPLTCTTGVLQDKWPCPRYEKYFKLFFVTINPQTIIASIKMYLDDGIMFQLKVASIILLLLF
jgi:hypothetical protein